MVTCTLYRPVGLKELELILDLEGRAFPPRLPEQPIFYPVLNREYAAQIARDWNPKDRASGHAGFVTEFDVEAAYLDRFEVKIVGARLHQELWVPAEELPAFNDRIRARIRVTSAFYGPAYQGPAPRGALGGDPRAQLRALHAALCAGGAEFDAEVATSWSQVLLNFGLWSATAPEAQGLLPEQAARTLLAVRKSWQVRYPELPLPVGALVG